MFDVSHLNMAMVMVDVVALYELRKGPELLDSDLELDLENLEYLVTGQSVL
jgi:hypothetical protein